MEYTSQWTKGNKSKFWKNNCDMLHYGFVGYLPDKTFRLEFYVNRATLRNTLGNRRS